MLGDEEMDDPDWYRENEQRIPCYKFGETGLFNLNGLKNYNTDWSVEKDGKEVKFNFCYYVSTSGCKPGDPESFAKMEKKNDGCL